MDEFLPSRVIPPAWSASSFPRELCFVHIPKTGGCSVVAALHLDDNSAPSPDTVITTSEASLRRATYLPLGLPLALIRHNSRRPRYMTPGGI